jgi:hypothetical protein
VLDDAIRIDNERRTVCDTTCRQHAIIGGDFSREIAEQRKFGFQLARPMIQRRLIIGADCQDLRFRITEFLDTSLVSGDFLRSTTGECGREEGHYNGVLASKVRQLEPFTEAAVQVEVGSGVADLQVSFAGLHGLCQNTGGSQQRRKRKSN